MYIRTDENNTVVGIAEKPLEGFEGWLDCPDCPFESLAALMDEKGRAKYRYENGEFVRRSGEEQEADWYRPLETDTESEKEQRLLNRYFAESLNDARAATVPSFFAPWDTEKTYAAGDRAEHRGVLYKCLQAHKAQADWEPGKASSLWVRIDGSKEEWPQWQAPEGAHDAYTKGDKVRHKEKHWISTADNNVWEPGALESGGYGWKSC